MLRRLFSLDRSPAKSAAHKHGDIDTDSNYCPQCGAEYRAEIETCADCGVALIPGVEKLANLRQQDAGAQTYSMEISAADQLVTIQSGKLTYLKPLQQLLKAGYVPSILAGDPASKG